MVYKKNLRLENELTEKVQKKSKAVLALLYVLYYPRIVFNAVDQATT